VKRRVSNETPRLRSHERQITNTQLTAENFFSFNYWLMLTTHDNTLKLLTKKIIKKLAIKIGHVSAGAGRDLMMLEDICHHP